MSTSYAFIVEKLKQIFRETFFKLENDSNTTDLIKNATRNYNATINDRIITSSGLAILTYVCLIVGCIGSLIVKIQQKKDPTVHIDVITNESAKNAPFIASAFLFGIFVLSKFIPMGYIITLLTYYIVMYTMCSSYVVVEYMLLKLINIPLTNYSLNIKLKNLTNMNTKFKINIKFTPITLLSIPICCMICIFYIVSNKHWILNNAIAMLIAIYALSYVHIQKLYHGIVMLSSLLVYDIFWVYGTNVMVAVATKMNAPVKLLFPNDFLTKGIHSTSLSLLGLGDVVVPGLYLAFLLRYDYNAFPKRKPLFFIFGLIFYGIGLVVTNIVLYIFKTGQPALLYLVPSLFCGTLFSHLVFGHPSTNILKYDDANGEYSSATTKIE